MKHLEFEPLFRPLASKDKGFIHSISQALAKRERQVPGCMPDLRGSSSLTIAMDFGGEHQSATHHVFSFVITNDDSLRGWTSGKRMNWRREMPDNRRMSFKDLRDQVRLRSLPEFLDCANGLQGLLLSVAFERASGPLIIDGGISKRDPNLSEFACVTDETFEKMLRVVGICNMLLAGFCEPSQNILLICDNDQIVANDNVERLFREAIGKSAGSFFDIKLGTLYTCTTARDNQNRDVEDLAAIPDLAAGAISHLFEFGVPIDNERMGYDNETAKSKVILDWICDDATSLKKMVVAIRDRGGKIETAFCEPYVTSEDVAAPC